MKRLSRLLVAILVSFALLAAARPAFATHEWFITGVTCSAPTITIFGNSSVNTSVDTEVFVNGVLIGFFSGPGFTAGPISYVVSDPAIVNGAQIFIQNTGTGTSASTTCGSGPAAVTFFNPNDSRVDPQPGDRLAIFCNAAANPPTLDVWGVFDDSKGIRLATFAVADLAAAGPTGLSRNLGGNGIVAAGLYGQQTFGVSWIRGPFNGDGRGAFRKTVTCVFPNVPSVAVVSVPSIPQNTGAACSPFHIVVAGDNLFRIAQANGTTVAVLSQLNGIADPNHIILGQVICLPG